MGRQHTHTHIRYVRAQDLSGRFRQESVVVCKDQRGVVRGKGGMKGRHNGLKREGKD